jgi:membrane protein YqaA with SNARE-associated domain
MKLFKPLYERAIRWAAHPKAPLILGVLSFFEAIIFPVMPEVMLGPMCLAKPRRGPWFASVSLFFSMLGAVVGYLLGHYAFELARPLFDLLGWSAGIDAWVVKLSAMVRESPWKAFWALVLAGFVPIPMKFFTWAAGVVGMPMLPFLCGMAIGRGKRVYLLAIVIRLGGEKAKAALHKYIEPVSWVVVALIAGVAGWLLLRPGHG